jgi:hypothetical protein
MANTSLEKQLGEFVQRLKNAAAENLKAAVLYGSAVTGEFHAQHSDLNLLCVVERADPPRMAALHPVFQWWLGQGHRAPLVFTWDELQRSADVFAIELTDMKAHHRLLWGEDLLAGLTIPLRYHSLQVERELRTNWLRLRQAILVAPNKNKARVQLLVSSFSAFAALFRHALIAMGEAPAANKREAIDRIAKFARSDPSGFHTILDLREGKKSEQDINVEETLTRYFALVEAVANEYDQQLDHRR